jgi:transcriptional regulator GlxA family with amidase domain
MMLVGEDVQDRWLEGSTDDALTLVQSLAEAGLLDGCEATTHWNARPFFQRCYPRVLLRAERILVPSGAEHRLVTSGGSTSWTDLALYLLARFCGDAEARHIAKIFLFGDRSDGQLPFAAMVRPAQHEDAVIAQSQTWIADNYAVANPVAAMVHLSSLNDRTFKRRFKAATGYAPLEYVQSLRIEEAKQILETTDMAIDDVASSVGYDEPNSFRRLFKRTTGISPHQYRLRFASIGMA